MIQCTANTWGHSKGFGLKKGLKRGYLGPPRGLPEAAYSEAPPGQGLGGPGWVDGLSQGIWPYSLPEGPQRPLRIGPK